MNLRGCLLIASPWILKDVRGETPEPKSVNTNFSQVGLSDGFKSLKGTSSSVGRAACNSPHSTCVCSCRPRCWLHSAYASRGLSQTIALTRHLDEHSPGAVLWLLSMNQHIKNVAAIGHSNLWSNAENSLNTHGTDMLNRSSGWRRLGGVSRGVL